MIVPVPRFAIKQAGREYSRWNLLITQFKYTATLSSKSSSKSKKRERRLGALSLSLKRDRTCARCRQMRRSETQDHIGARLPRHPIRWTRTRLRGRLFHGVRLARSEGNREFCVTYSWIGSIWLGGTGCT